MNLRRFRLHLHRQETPVPFSSKSISIRFDIYLKHGLGNLAAYDFKADKENLKLTMMIEAIRLLEKDETGFTSAKFLAENLKDMGYPMHKKKFGTYMEHLLDVGLVEKTGIYHYPYQNRGFQGEIA